MTTVLTRNWWALALRGVFAILLGLAAFVIPGVTLAVFVALFGAYAIVDGVLAIIAGVRAAERHERWWSPVLKGLAGIVAGVLAFVWPALTALALLYLIAAWAISSPSCPRRVAVGPQWHLVRPIRPFRHRLARCWSPHSAMDDWRLIVFGVVLLVLAVRLRNLHGARQSALHKNPHP